MVEVTDSRAVSIAVPVVVVLLVISVLVIVVVVLLVYRKLYKVNLNNIMHLPNNLKHCTTEACQALAVRFPRHSLFGHF